MSADAALKPDAVKPNLTIKRHIKAPPAKVYAAWTDAQTLMRWFMPGAVSRVVAELDPRVGGRYTIIGHTADDTHHVSGVYREVVPNEKLVFTWAWRSTPERESLVTLTFKPDGDGTIFTLLHEQFFDESARDRHNQGWTSAIDKLEQMFACRENAMAWKHGHFFWNEFLTRDPERAKKFYSETIGWTFDSMPTPDGGTYWIAHQNGVPVAGMYVMDLPEHVPEHWFSYLAVDDVDARVKKALASGAKLMKPIFDVPNVGRIAIMTEPTGAGVGWMTPAN